MFLLACQQSMGEKRGWSGDSPSCECEQIVLKEFREDSSVLGKKRGLDI